MEMNKLSDAAIGACIEVHRNIGPGLLESAYERCVCHEPMFPCQKSASSAK